MIAVGVTAGMGAVGYIKDYVPVGLALTTTALARTNAPLDDPGQPAQPEP